MPHHLVRASINIFAVLHKNQELFTRNSVEFAEKFSTVQLLELRE